MTSEPQTPAPQSEPSHAGHWTRDAIFGGVSLVIIAVAVVLGVQLTHGNSDYVCSAAVNESQQSACTGGSWGSWTNAGGALQRTYTGERSTVRFNGKQVVSCSHPEYNKQAARGTITTEYTACQIVETGTPSDTNGTGAASSSAGGAGAFGNIISTSQSEKNGAITGMSSSTGSYSDFLRTADDQLATTTFSVMPQLVRPGDTAQLTWSSSHVTSCAVTGTNGDTWPSAGTSIAAPALMGSVTTSAITQQTVYQLACITDLGHTIAQHVTINLAPSYQAQ